MSAGGVVDWGSVASRGGLTIGGLPDEAPGVRMELIDGSLIVSPLGDVVHQIAIAQICRHLDPGLELVVLPGVNVIVGDRTLLIPDVAVINPLRLTPGGLGVGPESLRLVVEVTSPSTRHHDLTTKRELYRQWGVPCIIYDRGANPATVIHDGELPPWAMMLL